jgi:hypothetical protein
LKNILGSPTGQTVIDECKQTFLLSDAQSGLTNPSGDAANYNYQDANSAYFIYEIGNTPNHNNVWYPFDKSPSVAFLSPPDGYGPLITAYGKSPHTRYSYVW